MILTKKKLRKDFLKIRKNLSNERKLKAKASLLKLKNLKFEKILSFSSNESEINTWQLNSLLAKENRLLLPRIVEDNLLIYEVTDLKNQLIKGSFNIFEPDEKKCKLINVKKISCVLTPGVAFDIKNQRLGYGRGFYDKFLTKINCPIFGIGYIEQLTGKIPSESHDIKVTKLLLF